MPNVDKKAPHAPAELPGINVEQAAVTERMMIPLKNLKPSPHQRRSPYAVTDLADSIVKDGLVTPITVRPLTGVTYEIIAGHRRVAAFQFLKRSEIAATVLSVTEEEGFRLGLVENLKRVDLNPMEEAETFRDAIKSFKWSNKQLAYATNRSETFIKDRLALLELPKPLKERVAAGLPASKANALMPLDQFLHIKGGGRDLLPSEDELQHATVDSIRDYVARSFDDHSHVIGKEWDSQICKKAGCLGKSTSGEAVCLNLEHALVIRVEAGSERMRKVLEVALAPKGSLSKIGITSAMELPVYYDLGGLSVANYRRNQEGGVKEPEGYPALPRALSQYSYSDKQEGSVTWHRLMELVKGSAKTKCRECPAWKEGKRQGRAILVKFERSYSGAQSAVGAEAVCMVASCRTAQVKASRKASDDPKAEAQRQKKARVEEAVQPFLQEKAAELTDRLAGDLCRVLALQMLYRWKVADVPRLQEEFKKAARELDIKIPADDGTPNGILKALLGIGQDGLVKLLAHAAISDFDSSLRDDWSGYDGRAAKKKWFVNCLAATATMLFGDKVGEEVTLGAKAKSNNAKQPDVKGQLDESLKKTRKDVKKRQHKSATRLKARQTAKPKAKAKAKAKKPTPIR